MSQFNTRPVSERDNASESYCGFQREDGRKRLLEGLFDPLKEQIRDKKEQRDQRRHPQAKQNNPGDTMLDNEGGIASIAKPKGFTKNFKDDDFGLYRESSDGKTKVCYWKRDDFSPEAESAKKIADILKRGPHTIMTKDPRNQDLIVSAKDEMDPVYDCLNPGRWSQAGGPFEVNSISVKSVNGKNVLSVEVEFQGGKKTTLTLFNPDAAGKTLEHLWVEGANKADVERVNRSTLASIKWKSK